MIRKREEEERRLPDPQYILLKAKEKKLSKLKLEHYAIPLLRKQLAIGTFSQVHIITMKEYKTEEAEKIVNETVVITARDFAREVNLHQTVSENSNIVSVIGIVLDPILMLMGYYKNSSLDRALWEDYDHYGGVAGAGFSVLTCHQFLVQLCRAIKYPHTNRILQRDLASWNLLLSDERRNAALADFGLVRSTNMIHRDKNRSDTVAILITSRPQSWQLGSIGGRSFGLKSDIRSIGITVFEIINKRPILYNLTRMQELKGTKAMIPQLLLLREGLPVEKFSGWTDELWII